MAVTNSWKVLEMKTVLSTKILTPSQKELFLNSGIGLVHYDAISIEFTKVDIPQDYKNYIFTSKNSVKAFLNYAPNKKIANYKAFCVGEKTSALLRENAIKIEKTAENALDLANFIVKNYKNQEFLFLSGNLRRDELPAILSKNNIRYKEVEAYRTYFNTRGFDRTFDGILFFSPSGIKSYLEENSISNSFTFCIGNTTANEVKKHTNNIIIANKPTVENVLVQAINYFKKND